MEAVSSTREPNERLALIGCGPAARENYIKTLANLMPAERPLRLVVDLKSKRTEVESYFRELRWRPKEFIFLDGPEPATIDLYALPRLNELCRNHELDGCFIVTEPKSHLPYLKWGVKHDLDILVEKPISSPVNASTSPEQARTIWSNFESIQELLSQHPSSTVSVMAQRRYHRVYDFIRETAKDVVLTYGIPITKIDISYSDGMWNMPEEFDKENHPYKYGYGMLHHGGYHFIDFLSQLVEINRLLLDKRPDTVSCFSDVIDPEDHGAQINQKDLGRLFPSEQCEVVEFPQSYGELDLHSMLKWSRQGKVICQASVNLQHTGITRRAWRKAKQDQYKGNGRIKQERIHIQVGPLLDIFLNSSEIVEPRDPKYRESLKDGRPGGSNQYDLNILRNVDLIGGREFERKCFTDFYPDGLPISAMSKARNEIIHRFLKGENPSPIQTHFLTNYHMSVIAESLAFPNRGEVAIRRRLP